MIVRISGEGQFDLADGESGRLNELEQEVVAAVAAEDEDAFTRSLAALLDHVRAVGAAVPDDALEPSQVILPPSDTSLAEASREFSGEGLIPD
jgi:PspA-Associated protein